ncbi:MAG: choice-of-anchor tandem repeat GloVer-containing protein [Terriglobales bacterium]
MKIRFSAHIAIAIISLGLIWKTPVQAQTFSVLYDFGTGTGDPTSPQYPGLIAQGRDGNLYSTGTDGGTNGMGAVFRITPAGKLSVLYSFDGTHGANPNSGLTLGTDGNFYGTTKEGGAFDAGTVFKITPTGSVTVMYSFSGGSDGGYPDAPPIQGTDGNFYGTTTHGGTIFGTVYKITRVGTLTTLYTFDETPHGSFPIAPLVQGSDGSFYGITETGGGSASAGEVYKITATGTLTVLYDFDGTHGSAPTGPLIQGSDGNFYGTTWSGGGFGYGVAFKITPTGALTVLHNMNGTSDGGYPEAGLTQVADGTLYGVNSGGASDKNYGTMFRITLRGTFSVLHEFDFTAGAMPYPTLVQHTKGILYGDTYRGGTGSGCFDNCGTFYGLNAGLKPFVSLVSTLGKVGKTIEILGQGLMGTSGVSFNGVPATFKVVSNTYLTAVVPKEATTGFVTVTTPSRKLTSNKKFRVN